VESDAFAMRILGMATFRYRMVSGGARDGEGGLATAVRTIEAPDRASAVRMLVQRGETPSGLEEVRGTGDDTGAGAGLAGHAGGVRARMSLRAGSPMSRVETASFTRELATAVQAGLPLVVALRTIAGQGRTAAQRAMLERVIADVEHGDALSASLERIGRPFTGLIVSLVHAGEVSGRLAEVLWQAAKLQDRDVKLRRSLLGALLYPIIIAVVISIAIVIVVTVIVPRVLGAVAGQLRELPLPTRVVQSVAGFVGDWWWFLLLALAGGLFALSRLYAQPATRLKIDRLLLRVPVLGGVLRDVAVARFTRTLGTLVGAGLPVLAALRVTKGTLNNRAMEAAIDDVCEQVSAGRTIAEPMEQSGYFPPLLIQIVNMGERTGKLDEMLLQAADAFEEKTEQSVKLFTAVLPPVLIILLACTVGFVVLAILLPLIEMQEAIG